jgi:predicted amidohydrolase
MKKNPIIAVAQIKYFDIHKENNIDKIKKYIRLAKKKHADIICFPESCVYKTETMHYDDKFLKEIEQECKKNSIWCIINEDFILRKKRYNMAVLINRKGQIKGHYKKIHLFGDHEQVSPGKKFKVFKTDFAKIGIAICWDLRFSKLFRKMKKKGAEIIFCPAEWGYEEKAYTRNHRKEELRLLKSLIRTRAFENLYFVALCNPVEAREEGVISYSAICSPHKILKDIFDKEGLLISKINLKEIKKFHNIYA